MKKRCQIAVRRTYSASGQCEKRHGLREVYKGGDKVTVCTPHREAIDRGRELGVVVNGR